MAFLLGVALAGAPLPMHAQAQNPIQAFKSAWKKAKQQAEEQQRQQNPQAQSQLSTMFQGASPTNLCLCSPSAAEPGSGAPITAAPPAWTPPTGANETGNATASTSEAPVKLDPLKLPDVVGLRLGMPVAEATVAVHKAYPVNIIEHFPFSSWPDGSNPNMGFTVLDAHNQNDVDMYLSFTAPPGLQLLWRVYRALRIPSPGINHQLLLNDLRAKYGRETLRPMAKRL